MTSGVATPPTRMAPMMPSLSFVMLISFQRVSFVPVAVAAVANDVLERVVTNVGGAALTAQLDKTKASAAVADVTPLRVS
jgi:hypothetical protein